ncbi:MAG: 16S rRNA (cytosine(1402)-N(4))-methyltransferase RsmH [Pseudomonadota bacterium]
MSFGAPHIPVMLDEVLEHLADDNGSISGVVYVDGTFGHGGYSRALLEAGGQVVAIDRDPTAIAGGQSLKDAMGARFFLVEGRFGALDDHARSCGFDQVDGVVLDIGVSSMQLDQAERGFSFRYDGPLDMRMEMAGPSAADVVNTFTKADLKRIISVLGEEKKAGYVAHAIVTARDAAPIETTGVLAGLVEDAVGRRPGDKIHPATRTFQALRIFVNRELEELGRALVAAEAILKPGGRLVVVSFHSLEDRIVKRFLRDRSKTSGGGSRHMPVVDVAAPTFREATRAALSASKLEAEQNPRARSAKLRAGIRLNAPARALDMKALGVPAMPNNGAGLREGRSS